MSNVMDILTNKNEKSDFKIALVLTFILVAISFFSAGFIYSAVPETEILIKVIAFFGLVNSFLVYYLYKKFNEITNT